MPKSNVVADGLHDGTGRIRGIAQEATFDLLSALVYL